MTEKHLRGEWRASCESPRRVCSICSCTTTTGEAVVVRESKKLCILGVLPWTLRCNRSVIACPTSRAGVMPSDSVDNQEVFHVPAWQIIFEGSNFRA